LFSYLAGPFASQLTTSNINEWPAVWCLFSIGLCLTIIKTPLRHHLYIVSPYWRLASSWRRKVGVPIFHSAIVESGGTAIEDPTCFEPFRRAEARQRFVLFCTTRANRLE